MNSPSHNWKREVGAIFRKEMTSELRSKSGLMTAGLFGLVTVVDGGGLITARFSGRNDADQEKITLTVSVP